MSRDAWSTEQLEALESLIAEGEVSLTDDYDTANLLEAVMQAGLSVPNWEYDDISSGSIAGLIYTRDIRAFVRKWEDEIDSLCDEYVSMALEGGSVENLSDMYGAYAQAAVSWASGFIGSWLDENSPDDILNGSAASLAEELECWIPNDDGTSFGCPRQDAEAVYSDMDGHDAVLSYTTQWQDLANLSGVWTIRVTLGDEPVTFAIDSTMETLNPDPATEARLIAALQHIGFREVTKA